LLSVVEEEDGAGGVARAEFITGPIANRGGTRSRRYRTKGREDELY
jgi:hypothetical protein